MTVYIEASYRNLGIPLQEAYQTLIFYGNIMDSLEFGWSPKVVLSSDTLMATILTSFLEVNGHSYSPPIYNGRPKCTVASIYMENNNGKLNLSLQSAFVDHGFVIGESTYVFQRLPRDYLDINQDCFFTFDRKWSNLDLNEKLTIYNAESPEWRRLILEQLTTARKASGLEGGYYLVKKF